MKAGTENRKKTIMGGVAGVVALICIYRLYSGLFGGSDAPTPAPAPVAAVGSTNGTPAPTTTVANKQTTSGGGTAGVAATKLASTSSSLDPTLDESAMLRTESLVYSGTGRNIFSLLYTPPVAIPKPVASPRNTAPPAPPVVPSGPPPIPPPPPINLKFFGTIKRSTTGKPQAFLLNGEDVYLASEGDIVARKYKIVAITNNTVQVTDLQNSNTQTLPLQMN